MLTTLLIFFPLAVALLIFVLRSKQSHVIALSAAIIELILSAIAVYQFKTGDVYDLRANFLWIERIGLSYYVDIDGISLLLVLLTTVLVPFIILSSFGKSFSKPSTFYGLILVMQMALIGVFVAQDGLLFYLFWEIALIPIYFICLIWGGENRGKITFKFFVYTLAGSLLMLIALIYLYLHTPGVHSFDVDALYAAGQGLSGGEQGFIFWFLFAAFAVKMPVFPFHTWQPDTYTVAPTQGTMLLSGIMLKMGIYGVIRWLVPVVPFGVITWGYTAILISVIGIIYASCIAIVQKDFKRLIAYASIAHVGLIAAGLFTLTATGIQGAMIQMISHGIVVVGMFFIIDIVFDRTKTTALADLGGIRNVAPKLATVFVITLLGSVALPLTSGFIGEFLLISSIFEYRAWLGALAGLTIILGAVYMLRTFQKSMSGDTNTLTASVTDLTWNEKAVLYPIIVLIILIGIYPAPILSISEPAVAKLLELYSPLTAIR